MSTYKITFRWKDTKGIWRDDTYYNVNTTAWRVVEQFKAWLGDSEATGYIIDGIYVDTIYGWESREVEW